MKVLKELGTCVVVYIVALVVIAVAAPESLSVPLNTAAGIMLLFSMIISVASLLLGGNTKIMKKVSGICTSAIVICIVAVFAVNFIHIEPIFIFDNTVLSTPAPATPPTPSPKPEPISEPNPTPEPVITPEPIKAPEPISIPNPAPVYQPSRLFLMGEDNYRFANSRTSFGYPSNYKIPLERYQKLFPAVEAQNYFNTYQSWGGSCFGFSSTSILINTNKLSARDYQNGVTIAANFSTPSQIAHPLTQLIELYQISFLLNDVWMECSQHRNSVTELVSAMDGTGLIIYLNAGSSFVHAVVAYDVLEVSGGVYDVSIYDNNYPNDRNRKMRLNANDGTWSYTSEKHNITCGSNSSHYFSFITAATVGLAVDNASKIRGTAQMKVILPNSAQISGEKIEIPESGAANITTLWTVSDGEYEIDYGVSGGTAVFFDEETSITIQTDDPYLRGTIDSGAIYVSESYGAIEIDYFTSKTIDTPLEVNGTGAISVQVTNGHLFISGEGELEISRGTQHKSVIIGEGNPITADTAFGHFTLWLVAGAVLFAAILVLSITLIKKRLR
jgi:hypothetical protein